MIDCSWMGRESDLVRKPIRVKAASDIEAAARRSGRAYRLLFGVLSVAVAMALWGIGYLIMSLD